jgi:hypothetical protein
MAYFSDSDSDDEQSGVSLCLDKEDRPFIIKVEPSNSPAPEPEDQPKAPRKMQVYFNRKTGVVEVRFNRLENAEALQRATHNKNLPFSRSSSAAPSS